MFITYIGRRIALMIMGLLLVQIIVACGGSGSGAVVGAGAGTATQVATFVDAPVSGLEFQSPSGGGITDSNGNFTYKTGEVVSFRVGNLILGSAAPKNGMVTPLDLANASSASDAKVIRILRVLQSLDSNLNSAPTMVISASSRDALRTQPTLDLTDPKTSDAVVIAALQARDSMVREKPSISNSDYRVSASTAQSNFESNQASNSNSNNGKGYQPDPGSNQDTSGGNGSTNQTGSGSGSGPSTQSGSYAVIAWNDLGMHCFDGKDYSIFSILPPFNNLHAQLVNTAATVGKLVTTGVKLTYESVSDPAGLITTHSADKTNFWNYAFQLFKSVFNLTNPQAANTGLTGNSSPSTTPAALSYNAANGWWEATGIPVVPYADQKDSQGNFVKDYYPMVKVVARDNKGNVLASTNVVLPVSDEMSCVSCHASGSNNNAKPTSGWVSNPDAMKDWKLNILRLHDQKFPAAVSAADAALVANGKPVTGYSGRLESTAQGGNPILCASCHQSNALGTAPVGSIPAFTTSMHGAHANVSLPGSTVTLNNDPTRSSCYTCHPGSVTKCLRGVMGNAIDPTTGNALIDCQSCHGPMSSVAEPKRMGWLDEPACQNCHDRTAPGQAFTRFTSVFSSGTTVRPVVDPLFATTADRPMAGKSLYRFSSGHGGVQCEACHGSTHAEYPSSHANDNVQSQALQGHVGTIAECTVCHQSVPTTVNGGPHGLHTVGQAWIGQHPSAARGNLSACATCHGSDYRGTALSKTSMVRTFTTDGGVKTFASGQSIGCYSCHNGTKGG